MIKALFGFSIMIVLFFIFSSVYSQNPIPQEYIQRDNAKQVDEAIKKGADVNAFDENGQTPLMNAAFTNSADVAELLIKKGANLNAQDSLGQTPLIKAAMYNSLFVAELLLKKGADTKIKDGSGRTALDHAKAAKYKRIIDLFNRCGVKE